MILAIRLRKKNFIEFSKKNKQAKHKPLRTKTNVIISFDYNNKYLWYVYF